MIQFDKVQHIGKDGMDAAMKSFGALSKGVQAAAAETADFAKRSLEQSSAAVQQIVNVRTIDKAMEIHTDFLRTSYENLVAQTSKMGELATVTAKEAYAPVEALVSKRSQTA
jgi:hypothetical protein